MPSSSAKRKNLHFASFEVDLATGEIRKHGIPVKIQDQPFRVLQALLERPGELVSREELQRRIWPSDTFVDFDRGLNNAVKRLREALCDVAESPRYIETLPKRGYRFIAEVENGNGSDRETALLAASDLQVPQSQGKSLSGRSRNAWLAGGVAAALLLSATLSLYALRTWVFAKNAGVSKQPSASSNRTEPNPEVIELLRKGRFHVQESFEVTTRPDGTTKQSEDEFSTGIAYIEQAIEKDRTYAPSYLAYARAANQQRAHGELAKRASDALRKALALDDQSAEVHLELAYRLFPSGNGWDFPELHYRRALELDPNSAIAHEAYAEYLDDLGRFDTAMREHERAQALDPDNDYLGKSPLLSPAVRLERMRNFMKKGAPDDIDYWRRGTLEWQLGQYDEAHQDWVSVGRSRGWQDVMDRWDRIYFVSGPKALIRRMVRDYDEVAKDRWFFREMIIDAHWCAGDRDGTLRWLEIAAKEGDDLVRHLKADHRWDSYRSEQRFQQILRDMGF